MSWPATCMIGPRVTAGRRMFDPVSKVIAPLAEVSDLTVRFVSREATVRAVNGVSFQVRPGEVLCILSESGCGKTVTLRALMRLLPPRRTQITGSVRVDGEELLAMPTRALRDLGGGLVAMIFQEPMTALAPVYTVGQQICETLRRRRRLPARRFCSCRVPPARASRARLPAPPRLVWY